MADARTSIGYDDETLVYMFWIANLDNIINYLGYDDDLKSPVNMLWMANLDYVDPAPKTIYIGIVLNQQINICTEVYFVIVRQPRGSGQVYLSSVVPVRSHQIRLLWLV